MMSKTASARFYRSSKKRVSFQQRVVQFNYLLLVIRRRVSVEKGLIFTVENNNKKVPWDYWFILMTNPSQTKP